jgi:hypothetical protein
MSVTMERFLHWKILPRIMMLVMTFMYIEVLYWFMDLTPETMTSQAAAVWLGHEK